jgi:hypothetical protein
MKARFSELFRLARVARCEAGQFEALRASVLVRRVLAAGLILALVLPGGLFSPQPAAAQALGSLGGFLEISQAFFGEGGRTFGPGEVITVSGVVPYITSCPGMFRANPGSVTGHGEGRFDFFPVADLYVIPETGAPLPLFYPLNDVSGGKNRVTGTGSGVFVDEVIAVTNPAGNLPAGRYEVVMDQCLDGVYDPGIDIVLGDGPNIGFEVVLPGPIQPINLHPVKQAASNYMKALDGTTFNLPGGIPVEVPGFCKLFGKLLGQANLDSASALSSWADIAKHRCGDLIAHYKGIAADPPDPNFTQFAEMGNLQYNFAPATTPLERNMRDLAHVLSEQAAASQGLLTSLERFQGAQVAGNDEYMMLQLEEANKFINLLVTNGGSLLRLYALLESFERELPRDAMGQLPEAAEFLAYFPEMRRAIASLFLPLGPQFKRLPANQVPDLIPSGLQSWIIVYLEKNPFLVVLPGLSGIPSDRAARGLSPIAFSHPNAASLGPFATPPARSYGFDASKSSDPNGDTLTYAWDFDGDGQFDDGTGAIVNFTFAEAGARLVAVKATDPAGNTDISYGQLNVGDVNVQDVIVMSNREEMYRVSPNGTVNTLRPGLPNISNVATLHVDVNGDIWVAKPSPSVSFLNNSVLERYDSNGSLLSTITRQQIENLVGFGILNFRDFVFDGRGDIILSIQENLGPGILEFVDFPQFNQFIGANGGRLKVLRLARDGSRASVIADVDQGYYTSGIRNGQLVVSNFATGAGGGSASLAINPQGQIVVGAVNNLIWPKIGNGIFTLDPDTGVMTEVIPPSWQSDPFGQFAFPVRHMWFGLGGIPIPPWGGINASARSNSPGIEVDVFGNYLTGSAAGVGQLRLSRTPIPPQITPDTSSGIINAWMLETFPLSLANPGTPFLIAQDIALDSGGDVIVAGSDFSFPTLFPQGVFRVTPLGQFSQVAAIPIGAGGFGGPQVLDVVPSVRTVAQSDLPPLPQFKLETLRVGQQSCPGGADLSVAVTNTGSVDVTAPVRVYFYDGDPEAGGVAIGSAEAAAPIAAGASVTISSPWPNPAAGIHQIYAGAVGFGSTPAHSFMVCVPTPTAGQDAIQLTPPTASANLGNSHTVTASVLDIYGNGIAGVPITFDVTGANTATGNASTNASGIATFTYAGTNSGLDTIVASFPNGGASNSVTQDWTGAATDTTPPVLTLPANIIVEATSPSGAVVNYSASANDAVDGPITPVCALASGGTFPLGQTTVNCTATDAANNQASSFFDVFVVDTTAPTLAPHANMSVAATAPNGGAVNYAAPTASDTVDPSPAVACVPASGSTFPLGTTTVNCTATDFSGNPATSFFDVFVQVGTPRIAGTLVARGSDALGNRYFEVRLTNTGTGHARNLKITQLLLRTLSGSGTVTYLPALSGALPLSIGSLDVGASSTVRLYLSVPATVTRFSITESGTVQNVVGTQFSYSTAQSVFP